jgi:hypothetical protein
LVFGIKQHLITGLSWSRKEKGSRSGEPLFVRQIEEWGRAFAADAAMLGHARGRVVGYAPFSAEACAKGFGRR